MRERERERERERDFNLILKLYLYSTLYLFCKKFVLLTHVLHLFVKQFGLRFKSSFAKVLLFSNDIKKQYIIYQLLKLQIHPSVDLFSSIALHFYMEMSLAKQHCCDVILYARQKSSTWVTVGS